MHRYSLQLARCTSFGECTYLFASVNVGEDCPVFDGMFKFSQISASGSVQVFVFEYMAVKSTKGCHEVE